MGLPQDYHESHVGDGTSSAILRAMRLTRHLLLVLPIAIPWLQSSSGAAEATPYEAQSNLFQPALLERPDVRKAIQSIDDRATAIVDEWIKLVEILKGDREA